jgi:hypothetical protein
MWRLLPVLALCGMPALCADVCGGLPTGDPKALHFWGGTDKQPPPVSFQLSVRRGGPAFRVTVRPLAFDLKGNGVAVHAGDIEVARCQDGKQLELLPIMAWQPIDFGASFHADDINFDGYLDFSVLTEFAGSFRSRSYWVYDPGSGLFVENELTRKLGENCLGSEWHGGCWKASHIDFDQNKREIRADYILSFAACSPTGYSGDRYSVKDNHLILIHKEEVTSDNCKVTFSDLIGGTMRVTGIRLFKPPHPHSEAPPSPSADAESPNSRKLVASVSGDLLYERPLDSHQEGLFSNTGERHQVGASQFVLPDAVDITGIRWYGYYNCKINPVGTSPVFDIRFFRDNNGLPSPEPIYSQQVQARVRETTARIVLDPKFGRYYEVYVYTVDSLPPLSIPAGQHTWISISEAPSSCDWLWNRSTGETGISAWGGGENSRLSKWTQLKDSLAFALYGRKIGPLTH